MDNQARLVKGATLGNGRWITFMDQMLESNLEAYLAASYPEERRVFGVLSIRYEDGITEFKPMFKPVE